MQRWGALFVVVFAIAVVARCGGKESECAQATAVGNACSTEGLRCPSSGGNPQCAALESFVCSGGEFVLETNTNVACTQAGLVCPYPETECGSCTCDGNSFTCTQGCCVCDGGNPPPVCPAPDAVVDGQSCTGALTCASTYACESGASGACTCANDVWSCACVANPTVIASNEGGAAGIALDATHVYWTAFNVGSIRRAPVAGGPPETVVSAQSFPYAIALDATNVYWANSNNPGDVKTVPKGGGFAASLATNVELPSAVAVDTSKVYWGTFQGVFDTTTDGGAPVALWSGQGHVNAITLDGANLYAATTYGVYAVPIGGGARVTLSPDGAEGIAVDATNVYWTATGAVMQLSLATKTATTLASSLAQPTGIAVDATSVYWTDGIKGTVTKVPIGGGAPVIVAFGQTAPNQIVVGPSNVYWTGADDTVKSAPK